VESILGAIATLRDVVEDNEGCVSSDRYSTALLPVADTVDGRLLLR
jgi:hypothetical protein